MVHDKHNLLPQLPTRPRNVLEFGCGPRKRSPEWIGIDTLDYDAVDIVGDATEVIRRLPAMSIDEVHAYHFMEHVAGVPEMVGDLARVLRPRGLLHLVVPHFSNPYYYSDLTHRTPFGLYSFSYLARDELFRRRVPTYLQEPLYRLADVRLGFKSTPPFYGRHAFKRVIGAMINISRYTQEFYEENLCYLVPCYEVTYSLIRL
jgi:hypothetical protein